MPTIMGVGMGRSEGVLNEEVREEASRSKRIRAARIRTRLEMM